jgi:hypothetical protein
MTGAELEDGFGAVQAPSGAGALHAVLDQPACRALNQPVSAENLCHQAILMDHASGTITPPDPELIQVDDAIGQRAQRRGLV